jgi:phosphatidate cytidylyltransferase
VSSTLAKRLVVAGIGIPAVLGVVYAGRWWLAAVISLLGVLGATEVYRLARVREVRPLEGAGQAGAALIPLAAFAMFPEGGGLDPAWLVLGGAAWLIAVLLLATWRRTPADRALSAIAVTIFGALYAAGLPAFLLWLRHPGGGTGTGAWAATWLVFLPLATTWLCDTAAMMGGSLLGGARLAPVLSPRKTWSGAIAGAVAAVLIAPAYGRLVLDAAGYPVPLAALALVGLAVGTAGQLGDLGESLLKREAGMKDSGALFPGHGGVLDRLDSLYVGIPLTVLVLHAFGAI